MKFDVHDILSGRYLANGWVDYVVLGELDDTGAVTQVPYTLNPAEAVEGSPWPMAFNIARKAEAVGFVPDPYVWTPPAKVDIEYRLRLEMKKISYAHHKELFDLTGTPIPPEVAAARDKAVQTYISFVNALPAVPEDWADDKYWRAGA